MTPWGTRMDILSEIPTLLYDTVSLSQFLAHAAAKKNREMGGALKMLIWGPKILATNLLGGVTKAVESRIQLERSVKRRNLE